MGSFASTTVMVLNPHLNMVVWPIAGPKPTPQYGRVANRPCATHPDPAPYTLHPNFWTFNGL